MSLQIKISNPVEFINNIASLYQTSNRIFMEYIDNSLDDAEYLFDRSLNSYFYEIKIDIFIDPEYKKVTFLDNCRGMDRETLLRIITEVGNSNKKAQPWTNGQFGFGVHSFRACAKRMSVTSKRKKMKYPLKIFIDRDQLETHDEKEVERNELPYNSGTKVVLTSFEKDWWKEINPQELKEEIEKHFEGLLNRNNLSIKIHYGKQVFKCEPFDYKSVKGIEFEKTIREIHLDDECNTTIFFGDNPIKVYLKFTDQIILNRRPVFLNKGRLINEIHRINSFYSKSKYRTQVWAHNNLIGYIELNGQLEPVISRNDFKRTKNRQFIYDELLKIEEQIYELTQEKFKNLENEGFSKLEELLSSYLAKLAKNDALRFRNMPIEGNDSFLAKGGGGVYSEEGEGGPLGEKGGEGGNAGRDEGEGKGLVPDQGNIPLDGDGSGPSTQEASSETEFRGKKRRRSGFNIKIVDLDPPRIEGKNEYLRSQYLDGTIYIYRKHPDFEERVSRTQKKEPKLNHRLIFYLASEISIHYKNVFFEKRKMQPEVKRILNNREELFKNQVDFIYEFEKMLQPLVNKNLIDLQNEEN